MAFWNADFFNNDYSMANEQYYNDQTFERLGYHQNCFESPGLNIKAGPCLPGIIEEA